MYWLRILASIAEVSMWTQLFFWMRLFDSSAQYVDLIINTVLDIYEFTKLLFLLLFTFTAGFYMIQINRLENSVSSEEPLFPHEENASVFWEAIFFQYRVLLGDFEEFKFRRSLEGMDSSMNLAV